MEELNFGIWTIEREFLEWCLKVLVQMKKSHQLGLKEMEV